MPDMIQLNAEEFVDTITMALSWSISTDPSITVVRDLTYLRLHVWDGDEHYVFIPPGIDSMTPKSYLEFTEKILFLVHDPSSLLRYRPVPA